jgi:hypothetical protein
VVLEECSDEELNSLLSKRVTAYSADRMEAIMRLASIDVRALLLPMGQFTEVLGQKAYDGQALFEIIDSDGDGLITACVPHRPQIPV